MNRTSEEVEVLLVRGAQKKGRWAINSLPCCLSFSRLLSLATVPIGSTRSSVVFRTFPLYLKFVNEPLYTALYSTIRG